MGEARRDDACGAGAMDWPLSRDEKKCQLLRLYSKDVREADSIISSRDQALASLRDQLETLRCARACHVGPTHDSATAAARQEADVLRSALENAAAVLRAAFPPEELDGDDALELKMSPRAKSEGQRDMVAGRPSKSALSRTPRTSLGGKPKRRVSFGKSADDSDCVAEVGKLDGSPEPEPEDEERRVPDLITLVAAPDVAKIGMTFKNLPPEQLHVRRVVAGSWAEQHGVQRGDFLMSVNAKLTGHMTSAEFLALMAERPLTLLFERDVCNGARSVEPDVGLNR